MSYKQITYRIHGLVQGVGFRPFVAEQAALYGVGGYVKNAGGEVLLSVNGTSEAVDSFVHRLLQLDGTDPALPGARVTGLSEAGAGDDVTAMTGTVAGELSVSDSFRILESSDADDAIRILPPDMATCKRCERELFDQMNRRYRHPFISCVSCGPRFTIMDAVPYDRERTTMEEFRLCPDCRREYASAGDMRHYAQTICCKSCGPVIKGVSFLHMDGMASVERNKSASEVAIREAVSVLKKGGIIAIKNVGGYHFAHMADNAAAAARLREAKAREEKPFAVMFYDIAQVERCAKVTMEEEKLLLSSVRPIVLLKAKANTMIAPEVCGDSNRIGAMLPADPIQLLLLKETGPLVMTSGNLNGEPILTEEDDVFALGKLGICDYMLYHDRRIIQGLDDSICQVIHAGTGTRVQILRRARGYVPQPVFMGRSLKEDTFAAGGDLKASFALGRKDAAVFGGHYGDLFDVRAEEKRREAVGHFKRLFGIEPKRFVCDRHPKYVSAQPLRDKHPVKLQHHHAHILSVMAEHHLTGRVLGVAFDGTGYGDDQTVWGGEFLLCEHAGYTREGHLVSVMMTGGDAAARDALASAEGYLYAAECAGYLKEQEHPFTGEAAVRYENGQAGKREEDFAATKEAQSAPGDEERLKESVRRQALRRAALAQKVGAVPSSSMGRLFDAAAVILGLGEANHFEGQLACRLQYAAERHEERLLEKNDPAEENVTFSFPIRKEPTKEGAVHIADSLCLVSELVRAKNAALKEEPDAIKLSERTDALAYAFHEAVACMTANMCDIIWQHVAGEGKPDRDQTGAKEEAAKAAGAGDAKAPVALSGGTFANGLLLRLVLPKLAARGYRVYMNEQVPCGDGGLALGQLYAMTF